MDVLVADPICSCLLNVFAVFKMKYFVRINKALGLVIAILMWKYFSEICMPSPLL